MSDYESTQSEPVEVEPEGQPVVEESETVEPDEDELSGEFDGESE